MKEKKTEYIIEMRYTAYVLQDAGQSSQFRGQVVTLVQDSDFQGGWDVGFQCYQAKVSIFQGLLLHL